MARPLDDTRTQAILRASIELLVEHGYQGFGLREVADRAATSLATIYRRWPSKQALLAAAIDASSPLPVPDGATAADTLAVFLRSRAEFFAANTHHLRGLMAAAGEDEHLATAVATYIERNVDHPLRALVRNYCNDAEEDALAATAQLAPATLIHRLVVLNQHVDPHDFAREFIELIDRLHTTIRTTDSEAEKRAPQ